MVDLNELRRLEREGRGRPVPPATGAPPRPPRLPRQRSGGGGGSNGAVGWVIAIVVIVAGIWIWNTFFSGGEQRAVVLAPISISRAVVATGAVSGQPSGVIGGVNPVYGTSDGIVLYVSYDSADTNRDALRAVLMSNGRTITTCSPMPMTPPSGYSTCGASELPAGDYAFQLFVNETLFGTYAFSISDAQRLQSLITFAAIASEVQSVRPSFPTNVLVGPVTGAGLFLEYQPAQRGDSVTVRLMRGDTIVSSCAPYSLSQNGGNYWCQMRNVATGGYEFHVLINDALVGRHPFTVEDKGITAPPVEAPRDTYTWDPPRPQTTPRRSSFTLVNPRWAVPPSSEIIGRHFPERALDRGQSGRVTLNCVARADGRLDCSVASESPRNWGFGEAALRASRQLRLERMQDGGPVEGGRIELPIRFQVSN